MASTENRGFLRVIQAAQYSWQGICAAYQYEEAFRQETWLALILIPLSFFVTSSGIELALLICCVILVLIVEILNSAIEAVVDRIGLEHHELCGRAKDMGSAAVMFALINVAVVWGLVLFY